MKTEAELRPPLWFWEIDPELGRYELALLRLAQSGIILLATNLELRACELRAAIGGNHEV